MTPYVQEDIHKFLLRNSSFGFLFNYVVEYQSNGYPHLHGTMFTYERIKPQSLLNLEQCLKRKYGKSMIYSTGKNDKVHTNDHFTGTWQQYIHKEQQPKYFGGVFNF